MLTAIAHALKGGEKLTAATATVVVAATAAIVVTAAAAQDQEDQNNAAAAIAVTEKVHIAFASFRLHYILLRKEVLVTN